MKKIVFFLIALATLVSCNPFSSDDLQYMPFRDSDKSKWGLIGTDGEVLCTNEFDDQPTVAMHDRFFAKNKDGKWELYTAEKNPKQIGNKAYDMAGAFKADVAPVSIKGKPIQFIDKDGNVKFELDQVEGKKVDAVSNFYDGVALFQAEHLFGLVNTKGEVVVNPKYMIIMPAREGKFLAIDEKYKDAKEKKDVKVTILSKDGEVLGEVGMDKYPNMQPYFSGDNVCVEKEGSDGKGEWGVIDVKGNVVLAPSKDVEGVEDFADDKIIFEKSDQYGLMNVKGETLIRAKYKQLKFSGADGLLFASDDDENIKLINENDEEVSKESYGDALSFHGSYAAVKESKDNWIFINKKGEDQKVKTDIYDISDSNFGDEFVKRDGTSASADFSNLFDDTAVDSTDVDTTALEVDSAAVDVDDYDIDEASSGDASGSYTMTGYVDKYPITMYLSFSGSNVTGWYYYDKYKAKMTFTGSYSGSSLDLYCEGGDAFYGTFVNGAYSGHFSGNNGNEMNFNVSQ